MARHCLALLAAAWALGSVEGPDESSAKSTRDEGQWLAPAAMAAEEDAKTLFIACAGANRVDAFDIAQGKVLRSYSLPGKPSGLVAARQRLYVTCAAAESLICELDLPEGTVNAKTRTGHTAVGPALSPDGKTLYVCLKFNNQVCLWDTVTRSEVGRIAVGREPVSVAPTLDGRFLLVAHHLPSDRATAAVVSTTVGVVDLLSRTMVKELRLPNGSTLSQQIRISPDGRFAILTHSLCHFQLPTTQVEHGWMNTAALTLVDLSGPDILATVLLDDVDRGAANPWGLDWGTDGKRLFITHAGTHEVSAIDYPALLARLAALKGTAESLPTSVTDDLAFMTGLRERIKLAGNGPRAIVVAANRAYVADYFSDTLEIVRTEQPATPPQLIALQPPGKPSELREGERLFNDATLSFQGWQSCGSCHSEDARMDGLNWDLLNDGLGNPKNTKSLLLAHQTPPAMSMAVRDTAEQAVRAGLQHVLFAVPAEEVAVPIDHWLQSLKPIPSPYLVEGKLSPAARRGQRLFNNPSLACASCHKPGLFTDLKSYDVGTLQTPDGKGVKLDTPTLVELWRTAPYLHDGSAATLKEALTVRNPADRHGRISRLSDQELNDLVEYLLSL